MKQNNLLKKVGSVVTTAAMLASLGTTGFADNADKDYKEGNGINIKSVTVTQVAESDTLFNVEVEYEGTATNNIGVTMLTYAKHGTKLDSYVAYDDTMQIVAVDQHSNPAENKFSFKVTTSTADGNAIYMEQGNAGIVAISGDGVTGLSAAKVVIPKSTVYATKGEIADDVSINIAVNANDSAVKDAIKKALVNKIVKLKNASDVLVGTTAVQKSWVSVSDPVDGVWKYTVTVPKDATVKAEDEEAPLVISNAISIADQTATVNLTAVEATKVSTFEGSALESDTATVNVSRYNFTDSDDLASELNGKKVEVIAEASTEDETKEVRGVVTISIADEGGNTTFTQPSVPSDTEHIAAGTYETTVTVKGATSNEKLTIPEAGLSFKVKFVVSDNTANGDNTLVNGDSNATYAWDNSKVTVKSDAENKENVSKLVLDKLKADGVKVKVGYTNAAEGATVQYEYITVGDNTFTFADPSAADNKIVATLNAISNIAVTEPIKFEFEYTEDTVYTDDKIVVTGTKDYTFKAENEEETTAKANIKTLVEGLTVKVDGADLPEDATKTAEVTAYTAPTAEANGSYTAKLTLGNLVGEKWPTDKTMEVTVTGAVKAKPQLEATAKTDSGVVADGDGFKLEAAYGASVDEIKTMLATAFDVKLDGAAVEATVSATGSTEGATVGTEDITLTLTVSKGDDTVTYDVKIDAPAKANKHTTVDDVNVNVGTSKEDALSKLPATVNFWVDGNESATVTANVAWASADYADKTAGAYDVVGTVTDVTTGRVVVVGETITVKANVNRIAADNQTATASLRPIADADADNAKLLEALKDTTIALGSGELAETYTVADFTGATVTWNAGGAYNVDDSTATVVYTFADGTTTNYYNLSGKTLTVTVTVKNSMTAPQAFKAENAGAYNKGNVTVYATADTAKDRTVEVKWFKYVNGAVDGTAIATSTATLAKDATEVTVATAADLTTYGLSANDQYAVKVTIDGVPLAFTSGTGTADFVYDTVAQIRVNGGGSGTVVGGGGIVGGGTTSKGDDVNDKGDENTGDVDNKGDENKGDDAQTPSTSNGGFSDVDETHWASEDIKYVTEEGLMNGTSEEEFAPEETLTRSMLVTVLYRAAGSPEVNKSIPFSDVSADSYYAAAVNWAQQNGIVNGVTESEFDPEANITREQIATIIYRYANYMGYDVSVGEDTNILSFEDAGDISEFAVEAMQYAVGAGLINGKSETTLNPQDNATRAEIAAILHRFLSANK